MFGSKEYIGLSFHDDAISTARLRADGGDLKIVKLDRISLVERISIGGLPGSSQEEEKSEQGEEAETVFGFEEEDEEQEGEEELDFEDLEEEGELSLDMVEEAEEGDSNEMVLYDLLNDIESKKVRLGLNIPGGSTMYQINRDTDFSEVKKKDLIEDIEEKLRSIYGEPKSSDNYSFEVRDDGSLLLASLEGEPISLRLINRAKELYSGGIQIESITPDEMLLVGLARASYDLGDDEITALVQIGKDHCRVVFLKGEEVWFVSPIINEGTKSKKFLNTVFSKILFQLDSGEVPSLDRMLLANNTVGEDAVDFFKDNFPDIPIENLMPPESVVDKKNVDPDSIPAFTTAIGSALAASGELDDYLPELNFIPKYVIDRQKIFQLEWHGMLILFLIFLTPLTFNYFYLQNSQKITSLNNEVKQVNSRLQNIQPVVDKTKELQTDLSTLSSKLSLLDTLARGTQEWSAKLKILNSGIQNIGGIWITSMTEQASGDTFLKGYSLYRSRIPRIVSIFDEATLMNVNYESMRDRKVFSFAINVSQFAASDSLYSPPTPKEVENLLQSNSQ